MKQYKGYVFDFDLTLVDSAPGIINCYKHIFKVNNLKPADELEIRKTIAYTLEDGLKMVFPEASPEELEKYKEDYNSVADQYVTEGTKPFPETIPCLRRLKETGAQILIVSMKLRFRVQEALETYGMAEYVDYVIGSEDVTKPKPDPMGLNAAIAYMDIPKEAVLYIGDTVLDAGAAKNAEVDFMGVTTGVTSEEELAEYPHVLIAENLDHLR